MKKKNKAIKLIKSWEHLPIGVIISGHESILMCWINEGYADKVIYVTRDQEFKEEIYEIHERKQFELKLLEKYGINESAEKKNMSTYRKSVPIVPLDIKTSINNESYVGTSKNTMFHSVPYVPLEQLEQMDQLEQLEQLEHYFKSCENVSLKILILLYMKIKKTQIDVINEFGKENKDRIYKIIKNKTREKGLLYDEYIDCVGQNDKGIKTYQITKKGLDWLKSIYNDNIQKEILERELETEELSIKHKIDFFKDFFSRDEYYSKILTNISHNKYYINVDFKDIVKASHEIAQEILDKPIEMDTIIMLAINSFDTGKEVINFNLRLYNLPKSICKTVGQLRSEHIGKLIKIVSITISATDVRPQVIKTTYNCKECGHEFTIIQDEQLLKEPYMCTCGTKGKNKFTQTSKIQIDSQGITVEEKPQDLDMRNTPRRLNVLLQKDLTNIEKQSHFENSEPITIIGILKEMPIMEKNRKLSRFDWYLEAINIIPSKSKEKINLSSDEIDKLEQISKDKNCFNKLVESFAPNIFNRDMEKKAMLLSLVSGSKQTSNNKLNYRDDSHLLYIGDPGVGKSSLMLEANKLIPGSRWVSSKSVTSAGLLGTVTKQELFGMNDTVMEKGALPMADGNVCFCDELDKMNPDHIEALHEPLENQSSSIDKWNKHINFRTDTTFIASCNPKLGRFDRSVAVLKQINLSNTLITRFDIIIPFFDTVGKEDFVLAKRMMEKYTKQSKDDLIEINLLREYLHYARTQFKPIINNVASELIKKYFVQLRSAYNMSGNGNENGIHITPRTMDGIYRLSAARAKLRFSNKIIEEDVEEVIELMNYSFKKLGFNMDELEKINLKEERIK